MEYKKKQIKKIISFLNQGKQSNNQYRSSIEPLFRIDNKNHTFKIENRILPEIPDAVNRNIKLMYQIIGNSEKEIYVKEWIIMSLNETLKKYKYYCENEQERIFDIAFRYMGMGHIEVLSCDLKTHLLFYRHDGGSSGWDRETNFQEMIKCDPETYQQFYFQNWIDHV